MANYFLSPFGKIDTEILKEHYESNIKVNQQNVRLDLNFEDSKIEIPRLNIVKEIIDSLPYFNEKNKHYIRSDYDENDQGAIKTYIRHHLEVIDDEVLSDLIDFEDKEANEETQILDLLHLVRVGFYPEDDSRFAIFDYSIGQDTTQYLVVVVINHTGNLEDITMES